MSQPHPPVITASLSPVPIKCQRYRHRWKSQKASGKLARCPTCWDKHGRTVLVRVPERAA